ncbi:MAG: PKD domain-containing protein [Cytophagales bacterium]|nr:PKD domain-containing protein [Cytophagales bacterium]
MNRKFVEKFLTSVLIITILLTACSEKDPLPLSSASFEVSTVSPEVFNEIKFENLSTNATSYEWDFGDGSEKSTEKAPRHTYEESAEFIVTLKAFTQDNQVSTETQVVRVGERYLTGMYFANINMKDAEGNPWDDDGSGPDVLMQLGPSDFEQEEEIVGFFQDSIQTEDFETAFGISVSNLLPEDYMLTNKEFFILLEEVDTVENEAVFTPMIELRFNPVVVDGEAITEVKRADGSGDLTLPFITTDEYHFFLQFEIR